MIMVQSNLFRILAWSCILLYQSLASAQLNCKINYYNRNNVCRRCPERHTSLGGDKDISGCLKCPGGMDVEAPDVAGCIVSENFDPTIITASGWRIWAPSTDLSLDSVVAVKEMKFFEDNDCSGTPVDVQGIIVSSGNVGAGWGPENAFQSAGEWGGKADPFQNYWLGKMFREDVTVTCLAVMFSSSYMKELRVQAYVNGGWENVMIRQIPRPGVALIKWNTSPTSSPLPSTFPSSAPSVLICGINYYRTNDYTCERCPLNHVSHKGSTEIKHCIKCPDGTEADPDKRRCFPTEAYNEFIDTAKGWRIWAPAAHTNNKSIVDVKEIKFYAQNDCSGTALNMPGEIVDSGHTTNKGPVNAFQAEMAWEGQSDKYNSFWIGATFGGDVTVTCMTVNFGKRYMKELRVQALVEGEWVNVLIHRNVLPDALNTIPWTLVPTASPIPSASPSVAPTKWSCGFNRYFNESENTCIPCPENHISNKFSNDVSDCMKCPDTMEATPGKAKCVASEKYDQNIVAARGWRIWAPKVLTKSGWLVNVFDIKLYGENDCSGPAVDMSGSYIDSGHAAANLGPENAFEKTGSGWGGSPNQFENFYLGKMFDEDVTATCMAVEFGMDYMTEARVQAYIDDEWVNVQIWKITKSGMTMIKWTLTPTASPVPSTVPSLAPSKLDCEVNYYMDEANYKCVPCPEGHTSRKYAKDVSECIKCPAGTEVTPGMTICKISENYDQTIATAKGWRIWAPGDLTTTMNEVVVFGIEFFAENRCSGPAIDMPGSYIDSGHAPEAGPANAFEESNKEWIGGPDQFNYFYIGKMFDEEVTVTCMAVGFGQYGYMTEVRVQAYLDDEWVNVQIWKNIKPGITKIQWTLVPTSSPVPSIMPSLSMLPTVASSITPTFVSSSGPSMVVSIVPTSDSSIVPTATTSGAPTSVASDLPTVVGSSKPTLVASGVPTVTASIVPTSDSSIVPTSVASVVPTVTASIVPTSDSSVVPTVVGSSKPTLVASGVPTVVVSSKPTLVASGVPTVVVSNKPSSTLSNMPSLVVSIFPTENLSDESKKSESSIVSALAQPNEPTVAPTVEQTTSIPTSSVTTPNDLSFKETVGMTNSLSIPTEPAPSPSNNSALSHFNRDHFTTLSNSVKGSPLPAPTKPPTGNYIPRKTKPPIGTSSSGRSLPRPKGALADMRKFFKDFASSVNSNRRNRVPKLKAFQRFRGMNNK